MRTDEAHQVTASRLEVWEHLKQELPGTNLLKNAIYGDLKLIGMKYLPMYVIKLMGLFVTMH